MNVSRNTRDKKSHDCRAQGNATEDGKRPKQAVVRRLVLALMLWSVLPAQAATPEEPSHQTIKINGAARDKEMEVSRNTHDQEFHDFFAPAKEARVRTEQGLGWDNDFGWLMN